MSMKNREDRGALKRKDLLPRLKREIREYEVLTRERMEEVAEETGVPLSDVYGVATFYSYLPVEPKGRFQIKVCRCVPCDLKDPGMILETVRSELGIGPGEMTGDGKFSLELVSCIGACDRAPVMMINDDLYGNLDREELVEILKSY